jgi:tol-pal system protein YbgF
MTPGQALPPIGTAASGAAVSGAAASGAAASGAAVSGAAVNGAPSLASASQPPADTGAAMRGRPPGVLGTLPAGSAPAASAGGAAVGAVSSASPAQYDQAMNLMRRAQYDEAAANFRAYADSNPGDSDLSPQAIYWVANISFIRQDYASAARTFAEVIKKYPKSRPAAEAMLKLAQSFMAMGQKSEGCTTLGLIKSKYPEASAQTLSQAATLRKTACAK